MQKYLKFKEFNYINIMKNTIIIFLFSITFSFSQSPNVIKLPELQQRFLKNNDTVYIINFWATWCAPCVKEIPDFERFNTEYSGKKVKLILVSLDFKKQRNKVQQFIKDKNLKSEVVLLDETNYNQWIDKISPNWEGAIPATLFVRNDINFQEFKEKSLTFEEIELILKNILNK